MAARPELQDIDHGEDDLDYEESLYERVTALSDIIPEKPRAALCSVLRAGSTGIYWLGKVAWVVVTSTLVLGLPLALEQEKEAMYEEYEKQQKAQEEQAAMLYGRNPSMNPMLR